MKLFDLILGRKKKPQTLKDIHQRLADIIGQAIPEDWTKAWIKAQMHTGNAEFDFMYVQPANTTPVPFHDQASPFIGDIYKSFKAMREAFVQSGQPAWRSATFIVESNGRFVVEYGYD
ncbi:immunity protein YezG family protein [Microvirga solisilvae]|uniref:immunity protein YezG family protein n=1 Tax=Microvirga solisilvae TaxID=2919498 RepID=UPI001FB02822|nr:immunity protein YezG family protein [Microvirga solisilvae]